MRVVLNQQEIIQACVEWAEKHHGLAIDKHTYTRATLEGVSTDKVYVCHRISIEFDEAKSGHPYRDGAK